MTRQIAKPNEVDAALGVLLRQRRKALCLSLKTLGDAVGVTYQQIQKYECGANRMTVSRLLEIAHALDCRAVDLVPDLDEAPVRSRASRKA